MIRHLKLVIAFKMLKNIQVLNLLHFKHLTINFLRKFNKNQIVTPITQSMKTISKHIQFKEYLERKHKRLIEEAYNLEYTDASLSDVLTYEALQLDQKLKFLQF